MPRLRCCTGCGRFLLRRWTFRSSGLELEALRTMGLPFFRLPWQAPFVGFLLSETADWGEVAELIVESYCLAAPKRLAALVDRPIANEL
jgi:hypothetical protein